MWSILYSCEPGDVLHKRVKEEKRLHCYELGVISGMLGWNVTHIFHNPKPSEIVLSAAWGKTVYRSCWSAEALKGRSLKAEAYPFSLWLQTRELWFSGRSSSNLRVYTPARVVRCRGPWVYSADSSSLWHPVPSQQHLGDGFVSPVHQPHQPCWPELSGPVTAVFAVCFLVSCKWSFTAYASALCEPGQWDVLLNRSALKVMTESSVTVPPLPRQIHQKQFCMLTLWEAVSGRLLVKLGLLPVCVQTVPQGQAVVTLAHGRDYGLWNDAQTV